MLWHKPHGHDGPLATLAARSGQLWTFEVTTTIGGRLLVVRCAVVQGVVKLGTLFTR
jgi:hypothetical protein